MVAHDDVPLVEPRHDRRRITASEVLDLAQGEHVPGLDRNDPAVQAIRGCWLTNIARMALADALRAGYLFANRRGHQPQAMANLEALWGWWCAAAGHPQIVLIQQWATDAVQVRCDLSSAGQRWDFSAWRSIGRLLYQQHAINEADWLFTPEELQIDGLEMEEAVAIVRALVDVTTAGRFRPESLARTEDGSPHPPRFPHQTRMERMGR